MTRNIIILLFLVWFASIDNLCIANDSLKYVALYPKGVLKKETKDVTKFEDLIKLVNNTINERNIDYLLTLIEKVNLKMKKENSEAANRISIRSKKIYPPSEKNKPDSLGKADVPKAYNSELIQYQQGPRTSKEEIAQKRNESEILSRYGKIVRTQQHIMASFSKYNNITKEDFDQKSPHLVSEMNAFLLSMKDEVNLLRKETGKVKKK